MKTYNGHVTVRQVMRQEIIIVKYSCISLYLILMHIFSNSKPVKQFNLLSFS